MPRKESKGNQFRFPDVYLSGDMWDAAVERKLIAVDIYLLLMVKSLSFNEQKGCYATNVYFSDALHVSPDWIKKSIKKLRSMGFLSMAMTDGKRLLKLVNKWKSMPKGGECESPQGGSVNPPVGGSVNPPMKKNKRNKEKKNSRVLTNAMDFEGDSEVKKFQVSGYEDTEIPTKSGFARQWVDSLKEAVDSVPGAARPPYRVSAWVKQFELLEKQLNGDTDRISTALEWFILHINDEYVPMIRSAKSFRAKLENVEAAMKRGTKKVKKTPPIQSQYLQGIKQVTSWPTWNRLPVPPDSDVLTNFLATLADQHDCFLKFLSSITDSKFSSTIKAIKSYIPPGSRFIVSWMEMVCDSVKAWKEWSGSFTMFEFRPDKKKFETFTRKWMSNNVNSFQWKALLLKWKESLT